MHVIDPYTCIDYKVALNKYILCLIGRTLWINLFEYPRVKDMFYFLKLIIYDESILINNKPFVSLYNIMGSSCLLYPSMDMPWIWLCPIDPHLEKPTQYVKD